jgi:hypothetical protein
LKIQKKIPHLVPHLLAVVMPFVKNVLELPHVLACLNIMETLILVVDLNVSLQVTALQTKHVSTIVVDPLV